MAAGQWAGLATEQPRVPMYRAWQAVALMARGQVRLDAGRRADAAADFELARGLLEKLVDEYPGMPEYRGDLGRTYLGLARATADRAAAKSWLGKADGALARAVAQAPDRAKDRKSLDEVRAERAD